MQIEFSYLVQNEEKEKKDWIIIVKVSPEFTKFYCLSDWPYICRSAVRALLLAGRISLKSFSQSMCQTGMQRINLQPETKIWKCPGGPGGMFLTPNSFSDLSDPACLTAACVQLCRVQPWAAAIKPVCGCSRAGAGAPNTAKPPCSHFCYKAKENSSMLWKAQECTTVFQGEPGCCACFHE